jgi:hypothetical protein
MATHAALAASRIPTSARLHSRAASRQVRRACLLAMPWTVRGNKRPEMNIFLSSSWWVMLACRGWTWPTSPGSGRDLAPWALPRGRPPSPTSLPRSSSPRYVIRTQLRHPAVSVYVPRARLRRIQKKKKERVYIARSNYVLCSCSVYSSVHRSWNRWISDR